LVGAVADEGFEFGDPFQEDVGYVVDYGGGLLASGEGFGEAGIDRVDVEDITEYSTNETISSSRWDDIQFTQWNYPELYVS
jgi:hypothetical protein